ncbi:MAG: TauD/TfdA dioxygenase family protein [Hyphomicrobiaceae bacterium]
MSEPLPHPHQDSWPFGIKPLHARFGCEITGLALEDAVRPGIFPHVYEAFLAYQLVLFRDVDLPPSLQVAFASCFGEVQVHVMNQYHGYRGYPEIYKLTNANSRGQPTGKHPDQGTLHWHTDGSWRSKRGLATMMYAEVVPTRGGETEFADMYGAYEQLPADWTAKVTGQSALHNLDFSRSRRHGHEPMSERQREEVPPVSHAIVRRHPETGREAIFLGDHAESIEGLDYKSGRALIDQLNEILTPPELVYSHAWSPGECLIWDNRCLLHRAMPFDTLNDIRVMRRCTTLGETPT